MGLDPAAPHPSSQLVKLGEAEAVGILDQDRVDAWNVQAALHNRGAEHHVRFAGVESHHGAFQFTLGHLACATSSFSPGSISRSPAATSSIPSTRGTT